MRLFWNRDTLAITVLTFVAIVALAFAPATISVLSPLAKAFADFDLTDLAVSQLRDPAAVTVDTTIVLVNIAELDRAGIAREVRNLDRWHPAVLGVDAFFRAPKGPALDTPLAAALRATPKLVLATKLAKLDSTSMQFDSVETSNPMFLAGAIGGFANLVIDADKGFRTVRSFSPREIACDSPALAFAVRAAQLYDSNAVHRLLARGNSTEIIDYRGNTGKFYALDAPDVLDSNADLSIVTGKIVLLGFLGPRLGTMTLEDVFFTPLNARYAGKTFPDMYGVVVHANIVSMILHGDYVGHMSLWLSIVFAVVCCHLNVVFLVHTLRRHEHLFDAIVAVQQLLVTAVSLFALLVIFERLHYKLDVTLAIVAMVLSGNVMEIYNSLLHRTIARVREKLSRRRLRGQ